MKTRTLLQGSLLLALYLSFSAFGSPITPPPIQQDLLVPRDDAAANDSLVVDLGYSLYRGVTNTTTNINAWKGIRFAAPPTGKLRWQSPQPPASNRSAVIDATQYASQCTQTPFGNPSFQTSAAYAGDDEDCLFLNVWAPTNASGLPVLVWIHGDGYGAGNGQYDSTSIINANGNNFVSVAIQYRLGAFGFLSSDEVSRYGVANAGILDQRFALEWVQAHIAKFGGDPSQVTIAGESAGGGSVMLHAMGEGGALGNKLFKNLIAASPYLPLQFGYKDFEPSQNYYAFAAQAGCFPATAYGNTNQTIFECLLGKDAQTLQAASVNVSGSSFYGTWAFLPVTDGKYVKQTPSKQLWEKKVNGERLLVGNNGAEGALFVPRTINTEEDLKNWLGTLFPLLSEEQIDKVLANYPVDLSVTQNYATNGYDMPDATSVSPVAHGQQARADNIYGELTFVCPSYWMAEAYSGSGRSSYRYQYSVVPALHGNDVVGYFGPPSNVQSASFVNAFQNIYGHFITNNSPSIPASIAQNANCKAGDPTANWPMYSEENPYQVNLNQTGGTLQEVNVSGFNATASVGDGLMNDFTSVNAYDWEGGRGKRCEFWRSLSPVLPN